MIINMEKLFLYVCGLCTYIVTAFAIDALRVEIVPNAKASVNEGNALNITCHMNQSLPNIITILRRNVYFHHISFLDNKPRTISRNLEVSKGQEAFYGVTFLKTDSESHLDAVLTVRNVRAVDDGLFECSTTDTPQTVEDSDSTNIRRREVVVRKPLSSLELKVGDVVVKGSPGGGVPEVLKLDAGSEVDVSCTANGSNPAIKDLKVYSGEYLLTGQTGEAQRIKGGEGTTRQYMTQSVGKKLTVHKDMDGVKVMCEAVDPTGISWVTSVTINVKTFDPIINCTNEDEVANKKAHHLGFLCHVGHEGFDIVSYKLLFGDTDVALELKKGEQHDERTVSGSKVKVSVERRHSTSSSSSSTPSTDVLRMNVTKTSSRSELKSQLYLVVETPGGHLVKRHLGAVDFTEEMKRRNTGGQVTGSSIADSSKSSLLFIFIAVLLTVMI